MKHLKTFENDDQGLLGDMQGLGLSPKPIGCYISFLSYGDNDASALGVVVIGPNVVVVVVGLYPGTTKHPNSPANLIATFLDVSGKQSLLLPTILT